MTLHDRADQAGGRRLVLDTESHAGNALDGVANRRLRSCAQLTEES
jgi:hypothetical protein